MGCDLKTFFDSGIPYHSVD